MIYLSFLTAFLVTIILLYFLKSLTQRIKFTNLPDDELSYRIPLTGGIALFSGFCFALLLLDQPLSDLRYLGAGAIILLIVGIFYDFKEISLLKLVIAEILVALIISIKGGTIFHDLGAIGFSPSNQELGWLAQPFTIVAILGILNAIKLFDKIEGLAVGLTLIALSALALSTWMKGLVQPLEMLGILIVVTITFIGFNLYFWQQPKAKVKLGNTGCLFLGLMLAWFMIQLSQGEQRSITPITIIWILALPLFDFVSILINRLINNKSEYLYQRLLIAGFTHFQTLLIMLSLTLGFTLVGIVGLYLELSELIMFCAFLLLLLLYFLLTKNNRFYRLGQRFKEPT